MTRRALCTVYEVAARCAKVLYPITVCAPPPSAHHTAGSPPPPSVHHLSIEFSFDSGIIEPVHHRTLTSHLPTSALLAW